MGNNFKIGKIELELNPVVIGEKKIELYSVKRWDAIENNPYQTEEEYIKNCPLWIKVWEASIVLSDHLTGFDRGKKLDALELGAGMGLTGLTLGALGHRVTITDFNDDALELLKKNVDHNNMDNISIKKLDWFEPDLKGKYDIICGSELIYKKEAVDPVIGVLKKYLRPDGRAFIAHDVRRINMMQFIEKLENVFNHTGRIKTLRGDGEIHRINLLEIRLK